MQHDHAFRIGNRKGAQQNSVNHAEYFSIGANAERQRHDSGKSKCRLFEQLADRILQMIREELCEPCHGEYLSLFNREHARGPGKFTRLLPGGPSPLRYNDSNTRPET